MLNFDNLPLWGKCIGGILLGLLVTFGIININDILQSPKSVETSKSDSLITVKYQVLTEDDKGINKVQVQFIFGDAPATRFTNTDGYVEIEIPKRRDITMILSKEGYITINRQVNPEVDSQKTIPVYMEKASLSQVIQKNKNQFVCDKSYDSQTQQIVSTTVIMTPKKKFL